MKRLHQGSHPTWKIQNFVINFSRPAKCLEFAQKAEQAWTFLTLKLKFVNSMFPNSLFKMSFTNKFIYIYFMSTLSTHTVIRSQINVGFHCFYLEVTWKIHGILCYQRGGNPVHVSICIRLTKDVFQSIKDKFYQQLDVYWGEWSTIRCSLYTQWCQLSRFNEFQGVFSLVMAACLSCGTFCYV